MKYKAGDLLFDKHPLAENNGRMVIVVSACPEKKEYVIWESINNYFIEWDSKMMEEDPDLRKAE